jgi:hypothetical protein
MGDGNPIYKCFTCTSTKQDCVNAGRFIPHDVEGRHDGCHYSYEGQVNLEKLSRGDFPRITMKPALAQYLTEINPNDPRILMLLPKY